MGKNNLGKGRACVRAPAAPSLSHLFGKSTSNSMPEVKTRAPKKVTEEDLEKLAANYMLRSKALESLEGNKSLGNCGRLFCACAQRDYHFRQFVYWTLCD